MEFIRDLISHFQRWCAAGKVTSFDGLCELIVLEQFKDVIPQRVATYVNEQKPSTTLRAAELADDFVLTHKGSFIGKCSTVGVIGDVEKMVAIPTVVQRFHQAPPVDLQVRATRGRQSGPM